MTAPDSDSGADSGAGPGPGTGPGRAPPPVPGRGADLRISGPRVVLPATEIPEAHGMSRMRLVQIYRIGSLVLGALLLAAFVQAGTAMYDNNQARDVLIDQVDLAALEQFRLSAAVSAQDTAIREYALDGGRARLIEYRAAVEVRP